MNEPEICRSERDAMRLTELLNQEERLSQNEVSVCSKIRLIYEFGDENGHLQDSNR